MATILIVEPPSPERERLVDLLSAAGHRVTLLADGDALARWRAERHDAVVLDEAAGGNELAARLKSEAFLPVVLVVGRAGVEPRAQALAVADDVVTRPFEPLELVARLGALLRTKRVVDELRAAQAESEERAMADATTGLRNRIFLGERLDEEWKRAARYNEPLSLLLLAVEGLRAAAEGRPVGFSDRVLKLVAAATLRSLRKIDVVTRFGAGELAALLPNTHFAGSLICAERLYREAARGNVDDFTPTVSMGIAFYPSKEVTEPAELVRLATRALERARAEGPGSICLIQHQGYLFQPKKA